MTCALVAGSPDRLASLALRSVLTRFRLNLQVRRTCGVATALQLRRACTAVNTCPCGLSPCLAPHCFAGDYGSLLSPDDERSLAPYVATPDAVSDVLLGLAALQTGETFVDLGAGDGRVLLRAVEAWGAACAIGWELDLVVHALALAHVDARLEGRPDLRARIQLVLGDARDADVASAHAVALYLLPDGHKALKPVLERQLPPGCGTRVVAHGWPVPGWTATQMAVTSMGTRAYLYVR